MEKLKVIPEEFQTKFKSKLDLYKILNVDHKSSNLPSAIV